jgi:hypothetical protein
MGKKIIPFALRQLLLAMGLSTSKEAAISVIKYND